MAYILSEVEMSKLIKKLANEAGRDGIFKRASTDGWGPLLGVVKFNKGEWDEFNKQYLFLKNDNALNPKQEASFRKLAIFLMDCNKGKYDKIAEIPEDMKDQSKLEDLWRQLGDEPTNIY